MSRVQLEQVNVEGLRELARQQGLDIKGARAVLLDRLTEHFEGIGWPEEIGIAGPSVVEERNIAESDRACSEGHQGRADANGRADDAGHLRVMRRNSNIQEIVQAVLQALEGSRSARRCASRTR